MKKIKIMEMTYDETLVMPSSYVVLNQDEMSYVEGGWYIENHWWGRNIYLTHNERQILSDLQFVTGCFTAIVGCGTASALVALEGSIYWNHDDGHGIKIRMAGVAGSPLVITGVWGLTKNEENNIAKQNKNVSI